MEKRTSQKKNGGRGRSRRLTTQTGVSKTHDRNNYKSVLREISSGGVVYKKETDKIFWLISKSKPTKNYPKNVWRLQKGWIDDVNNGKMPGTYSRGEKKASEKLLQKTAIREVKEEGGIKAKIITKIGTERFFYNSKERGGLVLKFVTFYLMEYIKELKGGFGFETEEVKWLEFDKAINKLTHKGEKSVLKQAKKIFDSGIQESLI